MSKRKMWFACGYDQCSRIFTSEGLLDRHSLTHKTYARKIVKSDRKYKCEICPASFDQCSNLVNHIYSHTMEKPFVCKYKDCKQKFSQKASLNRHMKAQHQKPNSFKCSRCPKTFNYKASLILHLRIHTGEKPYACEFCDYRCTTRNSLSQHGQRWHKAEEKRSDESRPKSKSIVFSNKVVVKLTPLSKAELSKLMSIKTEPTRIKQEKLTTFPKKIFPCNKCNKIFTSYQKLGGHKKIHGQLKIQQQKTKSQKPVNLKVKDPVKPKVEEPALPTPKLEEPAKPNIKLAELAAQKPKREGPLKSRTKWEEPAKPFPCAHCEMSYSYKSYLDLHMMSHRNIETQMQGEDNRNILSVEEDCYSLISEDDLQDTGSDNFDFESRVSDIDSTASNSDKRDDALAKELYWPTDCIETEDSEYRLAKSAPVTENNDILKFVNNCSIFPEPMSLDEKSTLNNDDENDAEQVTLLVDDNDAKNDSDMKEDENNFLSVEDNTETCINTVIVSNPDDVLSKEDLNMKNEVSDDSFTIIDESNDFHKAIVEVKVETINNDFSCHECGKKSRDQYLLYRHIQTQHNKGAEPWDDGRTVKRKKTFKNEINPEHKSSIDTLSTLKTENDLGMYLEEIRVTNQDILKINGGDSSNKVRRKKQRKIGRPVKNKTNYTTTKPYICSCKKKFIREKSLHKHLAMKIDCFPLHFQVNNASSKQSSVEMKNNGEIPLARTDRDELLKDCQNVENFNNSASFSCGVCKKQYSSHDILLSHIKLIHRKGEKATDFIINRLVRRPDKIKSFRCPFCPTTFTRYGNLMRHVKIIHATPEKKKDCSSNLFEKGQTARKDLDKTFSTTDDLVSGENVIFAKKSEHEFTDSPQSTEIISGSEDNCSGVGEKNCEDNSSEVSQKETSDSKLQKNFPLGNNVFLAINSRNVKPVAGLRKNRNLCSSCPKIFVSTYHLDRHVTLKHQEKTVKTEPQILIQHDTVKTNMNKQKKSNKTLTCPHSQCNRKFSSQMTLNYHMTIHTIQSGYETVKAFKELKMENQRNSETSLANFACTICGNIYANQFSLDRHMNNKRIHLPGYHLKRKSGYKRKKKRGMPRTTIKTVESTSRLKKLPGTGRMLHSPLKKTAQPSGPSKRKKLARPNRVLKLTKFPPRKGTPKSKKLAQTPSPSKLRMLANALCIPCSVYLERSLIVTA